ncbi:MAG: 6-aminohexanoate hydrolase, partial [Anaerolineae bacterium]|nr:6-aminohexanoate hydrolase [Anaerolineae bacterium]
MIKREYWPTHEWQKSEPASVGMDQGKLLNLEQMINSQYRNINGIVIIRNGFMVYERYFNGNGPQDTCHVASVTKSIISALIGIAIDAGHIK